MTTGVVLKTPRLTLRPARWDDLDAIHAVLSDPRATRWWSTPAHQTLDQTRAWLGAMIDSPPELSDDFVVEFEGRVVGKAGFYRLPEIGFILHPDVQGQGLGLEAAQAVIAHVFATRGIDRLTADVDPDNAASTALLTRLGFRETGRAERTLLVGEVWVDSVWLVLDRTDFSAACNA
ncbi:MAG: GNAT family N-acetyltransferase [Brevundimonas sp.]|uniref:GNAT family N-acetyltransferase n=1 Tax=Brevundimonas sp. TaxID=1871086 RepID=UPI00391A43DF